MRQLGSMKSWYLLEEGQAFSRSLLWDLQRDYFFGRGADAWRQEEVPHYITSNPTIARAYAEIVFAFGQDQQRLAPGDEPLHVCELGAGCGRFAFHFLGRLMQLCRESGVAPDAFRYVLTDFTQSNLDAWRRHPRFQPFFETGLLDMALFDVNHSAELALQSSGVRLSAGTLRRPLAVIANYLFDSVPQDLYSFKDQVAHQCLVSLAVPEDPRNMDAAAVLSRIRTGYDYRPLSEAPYEEAELNALLEDYRRDLHDAHLFFPATGIRCLRRLEALSGGGLLLLSADKGDHRLGQIAQKLPPRLVSHGSFSVSVNYHAFQSFCQRSGGTALVQEHQHQGIEVICLLMLPGAQDCVAARQAFRNHVAEFGPDDFFTIAKHLERHVADMTIAEVLSYVRFNHYDAHHLARLLSRLMELAPELSRDDIAALRSAIDRTWEGYFPLGEAWDLAFAIGCFFYEVDDYRTALVYFERAQEIYGRDTGTLYNMAVCHRLLNQPLQAGALLHRVIETDPANEQARALLNEVAGEETAMEDASRSGADALDQED